MAAGALEGSAAEAVAEGKRDDERHRRTGDGIAKLVLRAVGGVLEPGHAAEEPQVDPLDAHAAAPGDDRMAELVQEDAGEEQQRAREAEEIGGGRGDPVDLVRVVGGPQRPGDQRDDDQPKRVDADRYARQTTDTPTLPGHNSLLADLDQRHRSYACLMRAPTRKTTGSVPGNYGRNTGTVDHRAPLGDDRWRPRPSGA